MINKFATYLSISAFALIGAVAQANVFDGSEGQHGVSDRAIMNSIDQTPSVFGCEVDSRESVRQGEMPDIFAGHFDILNDGFENDSCPVPIPSPDQFRTMAGR